jgi:hypothetical protein
MCHTTPFPSTPDTQIPTGAVTVERVFHNPPSELVILTIGETQLRCTPPHLLYLRKRGWGFR